MSRSIHIHTGGPSLTGLNFETGLLGFLYLGGVRVDASGVGVDVDPLDDTRGHLTELPDVPGSTYGVSYVVAGVNVTEHWPEENFFDWRLIGGRDPAATIASLDLALYEGQDESAAALAMAEGGSGDADWVLTGIPEVDGDGALMWTTATTAESITWQVGDAAGTRTLAINAGSDLTGLDFDDLEGFAYAEGLRADHSGVTVTPDAADSTRGFLAVLPDAPGPTFGASYRLSGALAATYWRPAFFGWRLVGRTAGSTAASLALKLYEDTVLSSSTLTVTDAGDDDQVATGWSESGGSRGLSWVDSAEGTAEALSWYEDPTTTVSSTRFDASAQALIGHFSEGLRVKIWRRTSHPNPPALVAEDVPATMPAMSDETRALSGAVAQIYIARVDLKGAKLDGASSIELPDGKKYPFDLDLTAGGRLAQGSIHDTAHYVTGFLRAGA